MSQVEDVIVKKADAIVFVPVDYKAMGPGVKKINAANIPVVNVTDKSEVGNFVSFVGASDYDLGLKTATHLFKAMGGKGNVILLEGIKGSLTDTDRVRACRTRSRRLRRQAAGVAKPANYQRPAGAAGDGKPDAVVPAGSTASLAANDAMAIGAIEALQGANRKDLLVSGINGTQEAIDAIKAGTLLATGDYNGFAQGCLGTMAAIRKLRGMPVVQSIVLPATVVDKTNYQSIDVPASKAQLPALGGCGQGLRFTARRPDDRQIGGSTTREQTSCAI
ncbi:sugar ABC transporter substrate-binding protein [Cupriavidus basilensis]